MTATLRNRGMLAIALTAATGLLAAGCSTSAAPDPDRQAGSVTVPQLPACTSQVMADTKAAITSATQDRIAAEKIPLNNGTPLANNSAAVKRIAKAAMLDCEPAINVNNPSSNPPNVATIQGILDLEDWGRMIDSGSVGAGDAGASKPSGFSSPAESYKTFLTVAGRFPYFCGEKGTWDTVEEACQRELAAMFAHAVQETGSRPAPPGKEP